MPVLSRQRKSAMAVEPVKENVESAPAMEEDQENKSLKRKRGKVAEVPAEAHEEKVQEKTESPEEKTAREEVETTKARKIELKAVPIDQLKELVSSKGLEVGRKEDMVEAIVAQEAKARADARERAARVRTVMVSKMAELEALAAPDLKDLCIAKGITGMLAKAVRVEMLLKQWQEEDGVNKVLAKMARDTREAELEAMDKMVLKKLCEKVGVDPFVKEVIVERLARCEAEAGRFARPSVMVLEEEPEAAEKTEPVDMVDALLAKEAARKKEMEFKRQQKEAETSKRNELKAMTNDTLKKLLVSKGQQPSKNKDDMVELAFTIHMQEEAATAKKNRLKSLPIEALNKLVRSRGLALGKQNEMIESIFANEAKIQEAAAVYATKFQEVLVKIKADLQSKTGVELKELCATKALKAGVNAEERVERLVEAAKETGEVDTMLNALNRDARQQELLAMPVDSLLKLCHETGAETLVKEVMIERLLAHESQAGVTKLDDEPKAKKAKVSRK